MRGSTTLELLMAGPRVGRKVAIVTGAGAVDPEGIGNGRAAAILFAREGAKVLLVDRQPELAERTLEMIGADGEAAAWEPTSPPARVVRAWWRSTAPLGKARHPRQQRRHRHRRDGR